MASCKEGIYASSKPDTGTQNADYGLTLYPKIPSEVLPHPNSPHKIANDGSESISGRLPLFRGGASNNKPSFRHVWPEKESPAFERPPPKKRRISIEGSVDSENKESDPSKAGSQEVSTNEKSLVTDIGTKAKLRCRCHCGDLSSEYPESRCIRRVRGNQEDESKKQCMTSGCSIVVNSCGCNCQSREEIALGLSQEKVVDTAGNVETGDEIISKPKNPMSIVSDLSFDPDASLPTMVTEDEGLRKDGDNEANAERDVRDTLSNVDGSPSSCPTKPCEPQTLLDAIPKHPQPQAKPHKEGEPSQELPPTSLWTFIASSLSRQLQDSSNLDNSTSTDIAHEVPLRLRHLFDSLVDKFRTDTSFKKSTLTYFMEQFAEKFQQAQGIVAMNTNVQKLYINAHRDAFEDSDSSSGDDGKNIENPFVHDNLIGCTPEIVKKKYWALERRLKNAQKKIQTLKSQVKHYKKVAKSPVLIKQRDPPSTAIWTCGNFLPSGKACGKKNPHYKGEVIWKMNVACKSCPGRYSPEKFHFPVKTTDIPLERLTTFHIRNGEMSQTAETQMPPRNLNTPIYEPDATANQPMFAPQRHYMNTAPIRAFDAAQTLPHESRFNTAYIPPLYAPPLESSFNAPYGPPYNTPYGPPYHTPNGPSYNTSNGPSYNTPNEPPQQGPLLPPHPPTTCFPSRNTSISHHSYVGPEALYQACANYPAQSGGTLDVSSSLSKKRRLEQSEIAENSRTGTAPAGSLTLPSVSQNSVATTSAPAPVITPLTSTLPSPSAGSSAPMNQRRQPAAKAPKQQGPHLTKEEVNNVNKLLYARMGCPRKAWQQDHISVSSDSESDLDSLFEEADEKGGNVSPSFDAEFEAAFAEIDSAGFGAATSGVAGDNGPDGRLYRGDGPDERLTTGEGEEQDQEWENLGEMPTLADLSDTSEEE